MVIIEGQLYFPFYRIKREVRKKKVDIREVPTQPEAPRERISVELRRDIMQREQTRISSGNVWVLNTARATTGYLTTTLNPGQGQGFTYTWAAPTQWTVTEGTTNTTGRR